MSIVKYEREGARIWQRTVEILVCGTRDVPKARVPTRIIILHICRGVPVNMIFTVVYGICIDNGIPPVPARSAQFAGSSTYRVRY
jgi:hypothetical protein